MGVVYKARHARLRRPTVVKLLAEAPLPPSERTANEVPASLERIILRCLEKDPARRFPSARELLAVVNDAAGVAPWTEDDASRWWTVKGDGMVTVGAGR